MCVAHDAIISTSVGLQ